MVVLLLIGAQLELLSIIFTIHIAKCRSEPGGELHQRTYSGRG